MSDQKSVVAHLPSEEFVIRFLNEDELDELRAEQELSGNKRTELVGFTPSPDNPKRFLACITFAKPVEDFLLGIIKGSSEKVKGNVATLTYLDSHNLKAALKSELYKYKSGDTYLGGEGGPKDLVALVNAISPAEKVLGNRDEQELYEKYIRSPSGKESLKEEGRRRSAEKHAEALLRRLDS